MKRIAVLTMFAFGLASTVTTRAEVTGRIFRVTVKSSFGTTFTDCFRFDVPGTGLLTIDGLGEVITYRHGQLDLVTTSLKAVSQFGLPLTLVCYGEGSEGVD